MIIRWLAIGDIDGKEIDDTVVTVLHNVFYNKNSPNEALTLLNKIQVNKSYMDTFPIVGFETCVETAINIVMNRHINDNYRLKRLYKYNTNGTLSEYTINDYIDEPNTDTK